MGICTSSEAKQVVQSKPSERVSHLKSTSLVKSTPQVLLLASCLCASACRPAALQKQYVFHVNV